MWSSTMNEALAHYEEGTRSEQGRKRSAKDLR